MVTTARPQEFEGRASTTAVGLLCRMYLGWEKEKPGIKAGVAFLSQARPEHRRLVLLVLRYTSHAAVWRRRVEQLE